MGEEKLFVGFVRKRFEIRKMDTWEHSSEAAFTEVNQRADAFHPFVPTSLDSTTAPPTKRWKKR